jgi:hypothetical protein
MPASMDACVARMQGKADDPWALCQWMKTEGKGFFAAEATDAEVDRAVVEFLERGARVANVAVFRAGEHRRERYTLADLDDMVRNFALARGRVDPPVVIGHEERQPLLENTGLPAAGWVRRLWRDGTVLRADFAEVPPEVAGLINSRAYKKVSAEVYHKPPPGAPPACRGKMLRRVALLGGELPELKSLGDLPTAVYSEGRGDYELVKDGVVVRGYAEGTPMDRAELEGKLKALGWSAAALAAVQALPDDDLAALVLALLAKEAGAGGPGAGASSARETGGGAAPMQEPPRPPREQMVADLVAAGEDPAALEALTDEELYALWQEKVGGAAPMAEAPPVSVASYSPAGGAARQAGPAAAGAPGARAPALPANEGSRPHTEAAKFAELERRAAALEARQRALEAEARRRERADRLRSWDVDKARWLAAKSLLPRDYDPRSKVDNVYHRYMRASATRLVKFGERSLSELDALRAEVDARGPNFVKFFAEKIPDPLGADALADAARQAEDYAARRNVHLRKRRG